jgi:ATP-dependent Clp protease, protease subunit
MIMTFADSLLPRPPFPPRQPERPGQPRRPGEPDRPGEPGRPQRQAPPPNPAIAPVRVWAEPGDWPGRLYDRLLDKRIVLAHGYLDGDAATRLSAQLLTLDAEGTGPIRLEMQGLDAELPAALSVMGVLDVVRAPVSAYAGGRIRGPALGVLATATHRYAYPSAMFVLAEPEVRIDGTVTSVAGQEEQVRAMLTEVVARLAEVTGREPGQVRADAARETLLTVDEAISYGLIEGLAQRRPATPTGLG